MSQLDKVIGAIDTFYAPSTPSQLRQQTGKSLESFQNTVYAWNASLELLKDSTAKNPAYALFAAQTLKHKIILDWRQLDEGMTLNLRETLWYLVFNSTTPHTVSVQLKLALAALIVQMPFKLWVDPVADLFTLVQQNYSQNVSPVLEVLAMIPEQLSNRSIQFAGNDIYYEKCAILLEKHIDTLIQMVLKVLQSSLEDRLKVSKDLLACLLAWIQFGGNGSKIIEAPEFLDGLFSLLHSSCAQVTKVDDESDDEEEEHLQIIETCSELLVELIVRMSGKIEDWDDNQQGEDPSNLTPGNDWFKRLGQIWIPTLSTNLCKLPIIKSLQLRKESLQRPLITLLCESLELFLNSLMDRKEEFIVLSETVLAVAECPSVPSNILELTFNFWAALPAELSSFNDSEDVETRQEPFLYLFSRLFAALLRGPLIFKSGGSAEDIDKFREFRHIVGDCLKDCVRVMGSTEALLLINTQLNAQIPLIQREAALFALRTISSSVDPRESEAMPAIAPLLLSILQELFTNEMNQPMELKMISAVVLNVGCYSEWLRYHTEFIGTFLDILSLSLDYALRPNNLFTLERPSTVIGSSLQSLKYMCESCAGLLGSLYPALEALFARVYPWSGLCRRDRLDLTEAITLVLSRRISWTDEEFLLALNRILQLIWSGGSECLEDYAVVLECIMLPELPRTPLIFSQIFIPSFTRLAEIFTSQQFSSVPEEEKFCEAWLRVIQAALNNGTAGSVADFVNGPLLFWLNGQIGGFSNLSACKQATLFSLVTLLISGQFLTSPESLVLGFLNTLPLSPATCTEMWTSERCNLLRVCIIYVFPRGQMLSNFLLQSKSFEMLNALLAPGRNLSPLEIVGLCGFLAALFGALQEDDSELNAMVSFLEGVILRVCEVALLEWPLTHVNDLAMLLGKTGRDTSQLSRLTWSLFDPSTPNNLLTTRLFSADTSTPTELAALAQDYPQALSAACKNYRPKNLRIFLKGVAETCRRRRGKSDD